MRISDWSSEVCSSDLNSVEWGDGVFGAQAAAQHHFGTGAPYLSTRQASLLAAVLPNPRQWSAGKPNGHVNNRAAWIRQQKSEERRVGHEGVSTCRSRWSPIHKKTNDRKLQHTT